MKIAIILGTRPEMIKMSPIFDWITDPLFIHTGQHYDENMSAQFLEDLGLPEPRSVTTFQETTPGAQTADFLEEIEPILIDEKPDIVIVQGDTNSTLSGALAAVKLNIPVAHVEAGIRSFDASMPEEINRKIVDTIATYLFAPTDIAVNNLLNEGIPRSQIYNVGNTVVDAMEHYMKYTPKRFHYDEEFILCSIHRQENTDSEARLTSIAASLIAMDHKVVLPLHPRTRNKLKEYKLFGLLDMAENVNLMEPVGYLDMLDMLNACKMVLTDSGGLQEEAFILNKPCVTMRDSTERPETEEAFANILVGTDMTEILKICNGIMTDPVIYEAMTKNKHPYGNGTAASKIMEVLECETQAV